MKRRATAKGICKSCDGKGFILDTTYDRSGELVQHEVCYGTGLSRESIWKLLAPQRREAERARKSALTTAR